MAAGPEPLAPAHVENGGGKAAPAAVAPTRTPPAPAGNTQPRQPANTPTPVQQGNTGKGTSTNTPNATPSNQPAGTPGALREHRERNRNDDEGNVYQYYPLWPYAFGWGDDWGGNYNNNGTYVQPVYTPNNSAAPNTTATTPAPTSTTPSPASVSAQLTNAVNKSPEMVAANNAVQVAQVAYDSQRERVIAELAKTPEYQQALARKHDAVKDLRTVKESDKGQPAVVDAATAKMDASDEVTKMREQAVATDANAVTAKTRLSEAVAERDAVRAKLMSQLGQH